MHHTVNAWHVQAAGGHPLSLEAIWPLHQTTNMVGLDMIPFQEYCSHFAHLKYWIHQS